MSKPLSRRTTLSATAALWVYVGLLLSTVFAIVWLTLTMMVVVLDVDLETPGQAQIYLGSSSGDYSEFASKTVALSAGHNTKVLMLWSAFDVGKLRLKFQHTGSAITLNHLVVSASGYPAEIYNKDTHFKLFKVVQGIRQLQVNPDHLRIEPADLPAVIDLPVNHTQADSQVVFFADLVRLPQVLLLLAAVGVVGFFFQLANSYLLVLVAGVCLISSQINVTGAILTVEMQSAVDDELSVYWTGLNQAYTETKVQHVKTQEGTACYRLQLGSLDSIYAVRIDPSNQAVKSKIRKLTLSQAGYFPITLEAKNQFFAVDLQRQPHLSIAEGHLVLDAQSSDDFFEVLLNTQAYKIEFAAVILWGGGLLLLCLMAMQMSSYQFYPHAYCKAERLARYLGPSIYIGMLLTLLIAPDYAFDTKNHELLLTTAGEQAAYDFSDTARHTLTQIIAHVSWLTVGYGSVFGLALLWTGFNYTWRHSGLLALVGGLMLLIVAYLHTYSTHLELDMQVERPSFVDVYWADEAENYVQQRSAVSVTQPTNQHYRLALENLNNIHNLRIEPLFGQGKVAISQIAIFEPGYLPIVLNAENHFYAVDLVKKDKTTNAATSEKLTIENQQLIFSTTKNTEFFEIILDPQAFKTSYSGVFYAQFIACFIAVFASLNFAARTWPNYMPSLAMIGVRTGLALVVLMVLQLAWLSEYDHHPDEKAHIDSLDYFTQYSDFPVIGDGRSMSTYQFPWGISRLDDLGISYFIMGKFKLLLDLFLEDTVFSCRLFNGLLLMLLALGTRKPHFALFLVPLLCLPQTWYLFAYTNRDAFALVIALLLAWQWAEQRSYLQRYLADSKPTGVWYYAIPAGVLLGILSIELTNYLIFILFVGALLIWQGLFETSSPKCFVQKCLIMLCIATAIFGARKALDIQINGWDKQAQKTAFTEAIADEAFKPSVAGTSEGFFSLRLQQKGIPATDLFNSRWDWHTLTFKSFVGTYGNEFAEYSPEWYYNVEKILLLTVLGILGYVVARNASLKYWSLLALTAVFSFGALLIGFLYSWLYDFQPQGRYIFPLIPIIMTFSWKIMPLHTRQTRGLLWTCAVLLLALGAYSFRTVALQYMQIPG